MTLGPKMPYLSYCGRTNDFPEKSKKKIILKHFLMHKYKFRKI